MTDSADVVVVGAGFAGLIAARDLGQRGHRVIVCEARDRVGGRTLYRPFAGSGRGVELGGAWFDAATQQPLLDEIARYGVAMAPAEEYQTQRWFLDGTLREEFPDDGRDRNDLARLAATIALAADRLQTASRRELRAHDVSIRDWIRSLHLTPAVRDFVYARTSTMAGAGPDAHPMLAILQLVAQGVNTPSLAGGQRHVFRNGTSSFAAAIAADVLGDIRLDTPVTAIRERDGAVTVSTPSGEITAQACILAVPINVIGQIAFSPPLGHARRQALAVGNACRVTKVWMLATGVPARLTACGWDTPFCGVTAEGTTDEGQLLVAFALQGSVDATDTAALEAALRAYAPDARVLAADWHDWANDPWSCGGWMTEPPGWATSGMLDLLARPHGRVLMAGADVATDHAGWIAGAIHSGHEAAKAADRLLAGA